MSRILFNSLISKETGKVVKISWYKGDPKKPTNIQAH